MVSRQAQRSHTKFALALMLVLSLWPEFAPAAQPQDAATNSSSAMVFFSGRVIYGNGMPVPNATVGVRTFSAHTGILPDVAHTDQNGVFSFQYPAWDSGYLYASKPEQGYPDPTIALYDLRSAASMKLVTLLPGSKVQSVTLRLGHPLVNAFFQVTDLNNGAPISDAAIAVKWFDNPEIALGSTLPANGLFDLLLPEHGIDVGVDAPGFKPWHMRFDGAPADPNASTRSPVSIVVKLERR